MFLYMKDSQVGTVPKARPVPINIANHTNWTELCLESPQTGSISKCNAIHTEMASSLSEIFPKSGQFRKTPFSVSRNTDSSSEFFTYN